MQARVPKSQNAIPLNAWSWHNYLKINGPLQKGSLTLLQRKNCKPRVKLCHMKTASGVSKANEQQSASPSRRHLDELVENQDDQKERPKTGPERSELESTGLASIQQSKLRTKMVSLITLININFLRFFGSLFRSKEGAKLSPS